MSAVSVPLELDVSVSSSGDCSVGHRQTNCRDVGPYVQELRAQSDCRIYIHADRFAHYEDVSAALSSLQASGFRQISFASSQ